MSALPLCREPDSRQSGWRRLGLVVTSFFLLESDAISPPVGVPADRILYLDSRGKADWLVPKVTPVFYGIGSNGQLQSVRVGYDDLELAAQLEHLQMSSEGGSWIEK